MRGAAQCSSLSPGSSGHHPGGSFRSRQGLRSPACRRCNLQQNTIEDMKAFHDDVKQRAVKHGRKEEECQIIFTFNAMMIGATGEIVRKKQSDLELISNSLLEAGLVKISRT